MRLAPLFYATSIIMGLTSCDAATDNIAEMLIANEPTIVIPGGFKIDVSGRSVPVQGFDECPKHDKVMSKLFGPASDEGQSTCIVLAKDRDSVPVSVFLPTGTVREDWKIIRDSGKTDSGKPYSRTSLQRPDGSFVIPAEKGHMAEFSQSAQVKNK